MVLIQCKKEKRNERERWKRWCMGAFMAWPAQYIRYAEMGMRAAQKHTIG
jgi:hypothetical protein